MAPQPGDAAACMHARSLPCASCRARFARGTSGACPLGTRSHARPVHPRCPALCLLRAAVQMDISPSARQLGEGYLEPGEFQAFDLEGLIKLIQSVPLA